MVVFLLVDQSSTLA